VSKAAAPPNYVYENNKTYAVLDDCSSGRTPVAHCPTTHDAARLAQAVTGFRVDRTGLGRVLEGRHSSSCSRLMESGNVPECFEI